MKKPFIGITPSHDTKAANLILRLNYCNAIRAAGGVPIVLTPELDETEAEQLADMLDGVLLSGGPDIHPFLFGEDTLYGCGDISILRDTFEISFFRRMYHKKKPILGICRGAQLINIALGGNIYQDIFSQYRENPKLAHQQPLAYTSPSHRVTLKDGSALSQIVGSSSIEVNSIHHQAVKDAAPGIAICGHSADGLPEAIEMPDYPFLIGVQWHPEFLYETHAHSEKLFEAFVQACGK